MPSITDAVQSATANVQSSVGSALGGINSGASAATQAAQAALAPNAWVGAADNKLATADVYNPPGGSAVITDIENLFQKFNFSIADVLRGGKFIAAEAGAVLAGARSALHAVGQIERGVQMLTQGDIMSRILGASTLTKGALNALGVAGLGNIADSISSGINMAEGAVGQAVGQVANEVYASIGGVVQQISSVAATDLTAVGNVINSLGVSGSFSIADNGAKIGLYAGLIQTASGYGMMNSYGSLMASISDRGLVGQITMKVLPSIVSASDVSSLNSIGQTLGAGAAYAYNPNLLADFSSNYSIPSNTTAAGNVDYSGCFSDITDAYSSVDPNWTILNRQTTITDANGNDLTQNDPAVNLNTIMNGSPDFQAVIQQGVTSTTDSTNNMLALAPAITQTSVASKLASQFPMTVFSGNNQSANVTQDPLAVAQGAPTPSVPAGYSNVTPTTGQPVNSAADPETINPDTGRAYNLSDPGVVKKDGYYIWPNGHFQIGGTYTNSATGAGYVSKGITFD